MLELLGRRLPLGVVDQALIDVDPEVGLRIVDVADWPRVRCLAHSHTCEQEQETSPNPQRAGRVSGMPSSSLGCGVPPGHRTAPGTNSGPRARWIETRGAGGQHD
eukprot:4404645-Heterocapsa_arctica.AAC.2